MATSEIEWKEHYKKILLRFLKPGMTVYVVTLKHSRTSYSRHTQVLIVNKHGNIEDITVPVARFTNSRISNTTSGIITNEQSELISYLAIKLFDSSTALTLRKI
jgi:hypothetical protein